MLYRSPAYPGLRLRSVVRDYPAGVNLVTEGRPDLLYIRIQSRDDQDINFWHGLIPSGTDGSGELLPLDPEDWTAQELSDAEDFISAFGEQIAPGEKWEPSCAHTGPLYSQTSGSTAKAHVIIGLQEDQEQGTGSYQERGT